MPKSTSSVNLDLEDLLVSKGYDVTPLDSSGKPLPTADEAEILQFHFHRGGKDYGTVTVSIDGLKNMTVYYNDSVANSGINEDDMDGDRGMNGTSWISLVKQLKKFAQRHQLGFVLKDSDRLASDMRRKTKNAKLQEGKMAQLDTDLKTMNDKEFQEEYKMTKAEARKELKPKKKVDESENRKYKVHCSQCGNEFKRDKNEGYSHCKDHSPKKTKLDELDKKTLARYAKDAPKSADEIRKRASDFSRMGWDARDEGNTEEQDKWWSKAGSLVSKADRRTRGHDQAIDRLVKESKKLDEGYYGNKKMSYSDDTPTVKMVIKHNRQLEETDKRFRHIEKIFLETSEGERFGVPTTKPSRARMFARHIAEGGSYKDERWNHITEISEDIDALGGFIRATRSSDQFNESAQRMIGEAADKYNELRETTKRLQSGRGYNSYFESYEPPVKNDNDDDLLEVFKHSSVDSRIEKAMPTLNKLGIRRGKLEEADMFEQWADSIIDESLELNNGRQMSDLVELLSNELQVGPNGEIAISELRDIIENNELNDRLRRSAAVDSNSDARPQIIAWMQEQNNFHYRQVLDQIEVGEEEEPQPEPQPEPQEELPADKPDDQNPKDLKEGDMALSRFKKMLR